MDDKKYLNLEAKLLDDDGDDYDGPGRIAGYAAVFGIVDRDRERIVPGAFVNLDEFVRSGSIAVGHDWGGIGVATIDTARQDEHGLYIEATFLPTDEAQEVRKACAERLRRDKQVGLSIGYRVLEDSYVDGIRELKRVEIYEASIVMVPANPAARALAIKSADTPADQDQPKPLGVRLAQHIQHVNDQVDDLAVRLIGLASVRHRDGKRLGLATREALHQLVDSCRALQTVLDTDAKWAEAQAKLAELRAKYNQGETK